MMKKPQCANLVVLEIRNIRTFGYDVQGIYTLGPPSNEGGSNFRELNLLLVISLI